MKKQMIITLGREYGSLGRYIARQLAEKLELPLYDKENMIAEAERSGFNREIFEQYDEKNRNFLFSRSVKGLSNSIEDIIAEKELEFQQKLAESGESFVVVGRCSDWIFRDNPNALRFFVCGDYEVKLKHLMKDENMSEREAADAIKRNDKKRRAYHNLYCDSKWGDSRSYDLTINSSKYGIEKTVSVLYEAVKNYFES